MRMDAASKDLAAFARGIDAAFMSRGEALARRLEEAILQRELSEGQRLGTKSELREQFSVAAGTLNEALRILHTHGLLEIRPGPGGGVFVASGRPTLRLRNAVLRLRHDDVTVESAMAVRNALDPLVAEEAAREHVPEDIADLWAMLANMEASIEDPVAFIQSNWAVHRRLVECTGNPVLISVYTALLDFMHDSLDEVVVGKVFHRRKRDTLRIHKELVAAVATRDLAQAVEAACMHTPGVHRLRAEVAATE
ncbi:MAG: FCD domain-containing protein [Nitriliruptorales bacterium]|nr:FCD domain-containing protein [Nitriliruptorales bacterium]